MKTVSGIIVHQTGGPSAQSALNIYLDEKANGAHFLLDRDGKIIQTASLFQMTWHVGRLKARCVLEKRCAPRQLGPRAQDRLERGKAISDRFPSNEDSLGIEIVGEALPRGANVPNRLKIYEAVNRAQNESLGWLVSLLTRTLGISMREIFRHPTVSAKNETEASTARW